jgi:hypothetical protein
METYFKNYKALPVLLKSLLWLDVIGILLTLVGVCYYHIKGWQFSFHLSWMFFNFFILLGVLQKIASVRRLIVYFGWLLIMVYLSLLLEKTNPLLEVNVIYSAVFVWAFATSVAKRYFGELPAGK